jgi:cytochrome c biogenesis protein ResB
LTGAEPIEVTLDKYCINLFFGIARLDSTIEKQMLLWESANANANDTLFINIIAGVAQFLVFREVFCRSWFVLFLLAIVLSIEYGSFKILSIQYEY